MINLLPPDVRQQYVYGRRNTALRRWLLAFGVGLAGVAVVGASGMLYMQRSIDDLQHQNDQAQAVLEGQKLVAVQQQSQDITNSLKLVVQVLSREVLFSKLLKQIATVTPPNTALTALTISKVQGAIDITAASSDYTSATQLQINLQDPANKIFSKADIQNIICTVNQSNPRYPCAVSIRALFAPNNPFLFINTRANP